MADPQVGDNGKTIQTAKTKKRKMIRKLRENPSRNKTGKLPVSISVPTADVWKANNQTKYRLILPPATLSEVISRVTGVGDRPIWHGFEPPGEKEESVRVSSEKHGGGL
ncbi:hypothetical protein TNCV_2519731 [Trichonephila clavipes]|nr:hypothetical protein TNCV_2519731 [Trichonephila clavipes]